MLGQDTTATERLMGPFILMASFILITVMVIASMASFLQMASGSWEEITGTLLIGSTEYTMRNPEIGWNITDANVTDRWDHEASENALFYEDEPEEDDQLIVGIIRDNALFGVPEYAFGVVPYDEKLYLDYIMIYTEFGWWDHDEWAISYETIVDNQMSASNISVTEFGIRHNTTFALIVTVDGEPDDFDDELWDNNFNIKIGIPDYEEDIAYTSMWTVLGQVMTASLPDVTPEVNLIIGATMYAGIGMIVFTVISRMIPFIAGG